MKFASALILAILAALVVPFLFKDIGRQPDVDPNTRLPWQIRVDARGQTEVFGLQPGISRLADVQQAFGTDMELAIVAAPDEAGTLEGYYSQVALGFVLARVIVTVDLPETRISDLRERAVRAKHMDSATRKITLHPDDVAAVLNEPIRAISVIPTVNLDEATILQRFGPPGERLVVSEKRTHFFYPPLGLDVILDQEGKELLQYVAPRDFSFLREPLRGVGEKTAPEPGR